MCRQILFGPGDCHQGPTTAKQKTTIPEPGGRFTRPEITICRSPTGWLSQQRGLIKMYIVSCNLYAREEDTRLTLSSKQRGHLLWANVIFVFIYSIYTQQKKSRSLCNPGTKALIWMNRLGQLFDLDCPLPPPFTNTYHLILMFYFFFKAHHRH